MLNDKFFLDIASRVARESHCVSLHVGAVIVKDKRVISMGYNGTPAGSVNCDEALEKGLFERDKHHEWSLKNEIHAEMNALMFAAKNGIKVDGCVMYVTHQPCDECLKNIMQSGIKKVIYLRKYGKSSNDSIMRGMIDVEQYNPADDPSSQDDLDTRIDELKRAYLANKAIGNGIVCQNIYNEIVSLTKTSQQ